MPHNEGWPDHPYHGAPGDDDEYTGLSPRAAAELVGLLPRPPRVQASFEIDTTTGAVAPFTGTCEGIAK